MTKFQRRSAWTLLALFGLLLFVALGARFGAGWYFQSNTFRREITAAANRELRAEGDFRPLHFSAGNFYTDGYVARGKPATFFSDLRAEQIRASVNWRGLFERRWEIDELHVQDLDVHFADRTEPTPAPSAPHAPRKKSPWKLDLRRAEIAQSSWRWGATPATSGSVTGAAFALTPDDGAWLIDASSGTLTQTGWPSLTIDSAKLRYTGSSLFVTECTLRNGAGRLSVNGEMRFDRLADFQAQFTHISVTPLLPEDWRVRLHGNVSGNAHITAKLPGAAPRVTGDLQLRDGQLEAIPLLDQIATFTRTERFRHVVLTRGSVSFEQNAGLTNLRNLVLESEGLLLLEGNCQIARNRIDGRFQLGVTAASLQWLPGSQARVFTVAHDGYYWTPVHVTGPVARPHEDLTKRLIAAAAGELLDKNADQIINAAKSLLDLIPH